MKPAGASPGAEQRLHEEQRREDAADLDHEHHRVARLMSRIELAKGIDDRAPDDGPLEELARRTVRLTVRRLGSPLAARARPRFRSFGWEETSACSRSANAPSFSDFVASVMGE